MDYLVGHLIGDYLLQNDWQAMNKKANTLKGWAACLVHCVLYTLAVCACTGWWEPRLIVLVFLSHFPVDKTYVVAWFMIKVGAFRRLLDTGAWYRCPTCKRHVRIPMIPMNMTPLSEAPCNNPAGAGIACNGTLELDEWRNSADMRHKVWAYLLVDNTVHVALLWLIARYAT